MRTSLEQSILRHIKTQRMTVPGDRIAVAVSGGADSVALLRILEAIRGELGIGLVVVHFDHQLRGDASVRDAEFAARLAYGYGLEFFVDRADVASEARRNGWNLEDAARRLRYGFFQRVVEAGRATRVAVAHTADDQAETVLGHVMRGTGPAGLAGIYPVVGAIIRPLLAVRREELREYLSLAKQAWCEDASNQDPARLRARIRAQLLPRMERDFSPRIVEHLCDLARLSREEQAFWDALVEERFHALVRTPQAAAGERLVISVSDFLYPLGEGARPTEAGPASDIETVRSWRALTERIVRRLYQELRGDRRELTSHHVDQVIQLAGKSTSGRALSLPGGIQVKRTFSELEFSAGREAKRAGEKRETASGQSTYQYCVDIRPSAEADKARAAVVLVREIGIRFRLKRIDWTKARRDTKGDNQVLDANSLSAPLILRNWRPGDTYTPCGRRRPRKLKQMFLAARVPSEARRGWPVLESAGRVVWARGMPVAEGFCAGGTTLTGLVVEEEGI